MDPLDCLKSIHCVTNQEKKFMRHQKWGVEVAGRSCLIDPRSYSFSTLAETSLGNLVSVTMLLLKVTALGRHTLKVRLYMFEPFFKQGLRHLHVQQT